MLGVGARRRLILILRRRCLWRGSGNRSWRRCRCLASDGVRWQRSTLHGCPLLNRAILLFRGCRLWSGLGHRLLWLWTGVVEGDFHSNLSGILAAASQVLPDVALASAGDNDVLEIDPRLANQVSPLVVREHRDLKLVVVGAVVNREAQLLVPGQSLAQEDVDSGHLTLTI